MFFFDVFCDPLLNPSDHTTDKYWNQQPALKNSDSQTMVTNVFSVAVRKHSRVRGQGKEREHEGLYSVFFLVMVELPEKITRKNTD